MKIVQTQIEDLLKKYNNVPEYVMYDIFRGDDMKLFSMFNRLNWRLKVLDVGSSDFSIKTQEQFNLRNFGNLNPGNVPNDVERMKFQKQMASMIKQGENEPIIVVKAVDGYSLWEGWHRTMSILQLGDNGLSPDLWENVKIKAWVGSK